MREVAIELEANQMLRKTSNFQQKYGKVEEVRTEISEQYDFVSTSTPGLESVMIPTSSLDSQPLLLFS